MSIEQEQKTKKERLIFKTVIALFVFLLFFFVQGAIVVINQIEGLKSIMIRGSIIWCLAIVTMIFYAIKDKSLRQLGFTGMEPGSARKLLYFVPLLLIACSHFTAGFDSEAGIELILANVFFTLSIGMAEEIYFRGIICKMWLKKGLVKAVLVSAILFGICHLMNIAGGASVISTLLQICFAFVYGLVFALLFAVGKSIIPCILLHAFHDFCSYMSADASTTFNIVLGATQFVILIAYFMYLLKYTVFAQDKKNG